MKTNRFSIAGVGVLSLLLVSCRSSQIEAPKYDYVSVYGVNQLEIENAVGFDSPDKTTEVDHPKKIAEGIYDFLTKEADPVRVSPRFSYHDDRRKSAQGFVNQYFGKVERVRTLHLENYTNAPVPLSPLHPTIEAVSLFGGDFDLSELGRCPNVRFLSLTYSSVGESLGDLARHFPNLETLHVDPGLWCSYSDGDTLSFAKGLPRLKKLVYEAFEPIKHLEESVDELLSSGSMSNLVVVAAYRSPKVRQEASESDPGPLPRPRIEVRSNEIVKINARAFLRDINVKFLHLLCENVIPHDVGPFENIGDLWLRLHITKPDPDENDKPGGTE